jgi:outer membrane protein assembly factor BamA
MKRFLFFLIFIASFGTAIHSQKKDTVFYYDDYVIKVDTIIIEGNKITDRDVIMRELNFSIGDTVNREIMAYNSERIYSLGIFTSVNLTPYTANQINYVDIQVEESWYIYPIPVVDFQDRDLHKFSYGIELDIKNFRGRNETLSTSALFGYNPTLSIFYDQPYFIESQAIYLTLQFTYQNVKNNSIIGRNLFGGDFNQKFISSSIDLGKRLNLYNKIDFTGGCSYVESPKYIRGISVSNSRIDRQMSVGLSYTYDTRDLAQFPGIGTYVFTNFLFNGLGIDDINYQVTSIDLRKYFLLGSGFRLKCRFASRLTSGMLVPFYDFSSFGYQERIRGYYNQVMEGNDSYFGSVELNYPVIKDVIINFDYLPVIPNSLLTYRFAVYAELFTDTGVAKLWGQPIGLRNFNSGYGAGLIFLVLPYSQCRIEYAFNDLGQPQAILGLGLTF